MRKIVCKCVYKEFLKIRMGASSVVCELSTMIIFKIMGLKKSFDCSKEKLSFTKADRKCIFKTESKQRVGA